MTEVSAQDRISAEFARTVQKYQTEMESLERWSKAKGLNKDAASIREGIIPQDTGKIYVPCFSEHADILEPEKGMLRSLPREYLSYLESAANKKPDMPPEKTLKDAEIVRLRMIFLRKDQSRRLYALAKQAAKNRQGALGIRIASYALHADPDHPQLRKLFGYVKYQDTWRTPWEVEKFKRGFVDHEKFGWIPKEHVAKYESGSRYSDGTWISAQEDAKKHADLKNGWIIESEHFHITTSHSLEDGVMLRRRLDEMYFCWSLLFFRYLKSDLALSQMITDTLPPGISLMQHKVFLCRDEAEMRKTTGKEKIWGVYMNSRNASYTYSGSDLQARHNARGVMTHEVTHQLFAERRTENVSYGSRCNFWIVEGVAMFMQFMRREGTLFVLGDYDGPFLRKKEKSENQFYAIPTSKMIELKANTWSKGENPPYRQAAGIFQCLMHAEDGKYRDRLIVYLWMVYHGQDDPETFEKLMSMTPDEFDTIYKKYISSRL